VLLYFYDTDTKDKIGLMLVAPYASSMMHLDLAICVFHKTCEPAFPELLSADSTEIQVQQVYY
jgi:hypothetical protein